MGVISIQIQSILYHNSCQDIEKAIACIENAVRVYEKEKGSIQCTIHYGDASKERIFQEKDIISLKEKYSLLDDIQYTYFDENTGTAKGHNRLAKNCTTEYIMVTNPDVLVTPRYFIEMLDPFKDEQVGLVEARQTPIEHPKKYDKVTGETGWAATACVIFTNNIYKRINGFDENTFFMYCDDVDFSWRIRLAGYKVIYCPRAVVYHAKKLSNGGAWQPTSAEKYYSAEAAMLMAYKWSREDLANHICDGFRKSEDEVYARAAEVYEERKKKGDLPEQLDKEHRVAAFVDGNYAKHRFVM